MLAIRAAQRNAQASPGPAGHWLDNQEQLVTGPADDPQTLLLQDANGTFRAADHIAAPMADLFGLYTAMLRDPARQPLTRAIAHLGQSLDSRIATLDGDSYYVTGRENLIHLHRMRALCDAIIVGAGTVAADNPRLSTRLVNGQNPVRIIIDPQARLRPPRHVFNDAGAPTLLVHAGDCNAPHGAHSDQQAHVERLFIPRNVHDQGLDLNALVTALQVRGLHVLFVEGGGVTVSQWLAADLLDRLQIAVAPLLVGNGRPGLQLPAAASMKAARRHPCQLYQMGEDVMWDFDLRA